MYKIVSILVSDKMATICMPCFIVPALLFLLRLLQPYILKLWNTWKQVEDEKESTNEAVDKETEEKGCIFGCPVKPKQQTEADDKKEQ